MKIIDISKELISTEVYPGDPIPELKRVEEISKGASCNLSTLFCCVHNATHIDAPNHFIDSGITAEKLDLASFIGECIVIEAPAGAISSDFIKSNVPKGCDRLLIKGNGKAYFSAEGAAAAADSGLKLVGTDSNSVGISGDQVKPHTALLGAGIPLLEGLDLSAADAGRYSIIALPLKIKDAEATPVRAVLIKE